MEGKTRTFGRSLIQAQYLLRSLLEVLLSVARDVKSLSSTRRA